jgi:O-antigen/teichoic acid export membrane protein
MGAERFGILSVTWVIVNYLSVADFGTSRALINALAKIRHSGADFNKTLLNGLAVNLFLAGVAGIATFIFWPFFVRQVGGLSSQVAQEAEASSLCAGLVLSVTMTANLVYGAIEALEDFTLANLSQISGVLLYQVFPLFAVLFCGPSVQVFLLASLLSKVIELLTISTILFYRTRGPCPRGIDLNLISRLFFYGSWVTISGLISPLLASSDQILLAKIKGAQAVAMYSIPFSMAMKILLIPGAITRVLFPRASRVSSTEAHLMAERSIAVVAHLTCALLAPCAFVVDILLRIWIGADFAVAAEPASRLLLLAAWANSVAWVPYSYLQSQGRPDISAKLHLLEVLPFLAGLTAAIHFYGAVGAALAWLVRAVVDMALLVSVSKVSNYNRRSLLFLSAVMCMTFLKDANSYVNVALSFVVFVFVICLSYLRCKDFRDGLVQAMTYVSKRIGKFVERRANV